MIFQHCDKCGKRKLYTAKRSFMDKRIDKRPVTTTGKLCNPCWRRLKRIIKKTNPIK